MKTWRECLILRKHISQLRIANHQIFGEIQNNFKGSGMFLALNIIPQIYAALHQLGWPLMLLKIILRNNYL